LASSAAAADDGEADARPVQYVPDPGRVGRGRRRLCLAKS
jgi:hypothetical protein